MVLTSFGHWSIQRTNLRKSMTSQAKSRKSRLRSKKGLNRSRSSSKRSRRSLKMHSCDALPLTTYTAERRRDLDPMTSLPRRQ
jgi:hypothetical protein